MGRRLTAYVHAGGRWYGPDDDVPAEVARQIGDHAWSDDPAIQRPPAPTGAGGRAVDVPPRSGRGSGIEAWRRYAERHGVDAGPDMSREDIIAACERAGVIEREE